MGELVFRLILTALEIVFELLCYFTGRIVVPALSFGRYTVLPLRGSPVITPNRRPIQLSHETGSFLGLMFWIVAIAVGAAIYWFTVR